tara:strand:+ start:296 stop:457 length:162 start_codon:yes stop_codon:yes gene_type:complete
MAFTKLGDCLGELYSKSQLEALQIEAETDDAQYDEQYAYYSRKAMAEAMAPVA